MSLTPADDQGDVFDKLVGAAFGLIPIPGAGLMSAPVERLTRALRDDTKRRRSIALKTAIETSGQGAADVGVCVRPVLRQVTEEDPLEDDQPTSDSDDDDGDGDGDDGPGPEGASRRVTVACGLSPIDPGSPHFDERVIPGTRSVEGRRYRRLKSRDPVAS